MRKFIVPVLGLAVLLIVGISTARHSQTPQLGLVPAAPRAALPLTTKTPTDAPAQVPADTASPAPTAIAAAPSSGGVTPPPAAPPPSDLPTIEVAPLPIHSVDEDSVLPVPHVTLSNQAGQTMVPRGAAAAAPVPRQLAMAPAAVAPLRGPAQASDATTLTIGGRSVRLFGIRAPEPRSRCTLNSGPAQPCDAVARQALAQRLARQPTVSCHIPPGQRASVPGAICVDGGGVDLGGLLVSEGLALADTDASYDYFGPQGVARSFRRGLWGSH